MGQELATYDPGDVIFTFNGAVISGYAEDSFISVERTSDLYTMKTGGAGDVVRSRSRDRSATITFKLLQTSPANAILQAFADADQQGLGVGPVSVTDLLSTNSLCHGQLAWISKLPNAEYGKEAGEREWKIQCSNLEMAIGGNPV